MADRSVLAKKALPLAQKAETDGGETLESGQHHEWLITVSWNNLNRYRRLHRVTSE